MKLLLTNPHLSSRGEALVNAYKWMADGLPSVAVSLETMTAYIIRDLAHYCHSNGVLWDTVEAVLADLVDQDNDEADRFE